jgi:coenzyme PQQ precursor peptide PqqA
VISPAWFDFHTNFPLSGDFETGTLAWCKSSVQLKNGETMKSQWKTPRIEEIAVGLEINSYACAEL